MDRRELRLIDIYILAKLRMIIAMQREKFINFFFKKKGFNWSLGLAHSPSRLLGRG
jgi:hypothetical protein